MHVILPEKQRHRLLTDMGKIKNTNPISTGRFNPRRSEITKFFKSLTEAKCKDSGGAKGWNTRIH